jgi:hypothetical protein
MKDFMKPTYRHLAGLFLLCLAIAAHAEEGGVGHYAPGSFASFVDVLPGEPAVGVFNYFLYYNGSGSDTRTPVDESYELPFRFTGTIDKLTFKLGPEQLAAADKKAIEKAVAKAND